MPPFKSPATAEACPKGWVPSSCEGVYRQPNQPGCAPPPKGIGAGPIENKLHTATFIYEHPSQTQFSGIYAEWARAGYYAAVYRQPNQPGRAPPKGICSGPIENKRCTDNIEMENLKEIPWECKFLQNLSSMQIEKYFMKFQNCSIETKYFFCKAEY